MSESQQQRCFWDGVSINEAPIHKKKETPKSFYFRYSITGK